MHSSKLKLNRSLVVALVMALAIPSALAEWKLLSENDVQTNYVDNESVVMADGFVIMTVLYNRRDVVMFFDKEVRSTKIRYKFDCLGQTFTPLDSTSYFGPMATGAVSDSASLATNWRQVTPTTPGDDFFNFACGLRSDYPVS